MTVRSCSTSTTGRCADQPEPVAVVADVGERTGLVARFAEATHRVSVAHRAGLQIAEDVLPDPEGVVACAVATHEHVALVPCESIEGGQRGAPVEIATSAPCRARTPGRRARSRRRRGRSCCCTRPPGCAARRRRSPPVPSSRCRRCRPTGARCHPVCRPSAMRPLMLSRSTKALLASTSWRQSRPVRRRKATCASPPSITRPRQLSWTSRKRVFDSL